MVDILVSTPLNYTMHRSRIVPLSLFRLKPPVSNIGTCRPNCLVENIVFVPNVHHNTKDSIFMLTLFFLLQSLARCYLDAPVAVW